MKIGIYAVARLDENTDSINHQREQCLAWAAAKGHDVVGVITAGEFAAQDQGPHRSLMKAVQSRQYEGLVASEPDRYDRLTARLQEVQDAAAVADVQLFTVEPDQRLVDPLTRRLEGALLVRSVSVVVAVIVRGDKVLLVRSAKVNDEVPWRFPGGKVEGGEISEQAAIREVREETGLRVTATRYLGYREHPRTRRSITYLACEAGDGEAYAASPREIAEVAWCTMEEVALKIPFGIFALVQRHLVREIAGQEVE